MPSSPVIRSDDVDALGFPWGVIKWLMNDETGADAQQTFGIVYISAGQQNPPRTTIPTVKNSSTSFTAPASILWETNPTGWVPGDLIRVPAGVVHQAVNTGWEPLRVVISFFSGDRKTVFLDREKA